MTASLHSVQLITPHLKGWRGASDNLLKTLSLTTVDEERETKTNQKTPPARRQKPFSKEIDRERERERERDHAP
jgi:hypothetical protein